MKYGRRFGLHDVVVARAAIAEADELSGLAQRAKAHWGYPAEWLAEWRLQLTLSSKTFEEQIVFAARRDGTSLGFYGLACRDGTASLEHLWIDPPFIGMGVGRLLLRHAQRQAQWKGCDSLQIDSDPNAEAFYLHMGAVRTGSVEAPVAGLARRLPRLRLDAACLGA